MDIGDNVLAPGRNYFPKGLLIKIESLWKLFLY